jgi:integrase/recombinase XerD
MASIKLILRTYQQDQAGHSPLYIRVIKDRKTKFISVGVKLKESEWDDAKQKVKKNHPNSARMNASLSQKVADAEAQVADLERKTKSISIGKIKEAIKGKEVPNFFEYAYERCKKIKGNLAVSSHRSYVMNIKKFEDYLGTSNIHFDDITVSVLMDYVSYLSNVKKNSDTTQRQKIIILAIMFKEAIKEDIIPPHLYPFSKIKLKRNNTSRSFLTKEQIQDLLNLEFASGSISEIARDMFIFSIYAGGLRFGDVLELQHQHYHAGESKIRKTILKTSRLHQFKMGTVALEILSKYIKVDAEPNDFIFPIIKDKALYNKDEENKYKIIESGNSLCNTYLKKMGKSIKLPFTLSFHLSRHSFATNALNNGMRIEHVSKLLDHRDIKTTQIYAKILGEELDKAVDDYIY